MLFAEFVEIQYFAVEQYGNAAVGSLPRLWPVLEQTMVEQCSGPVRTCQSMGLTDTRPALHGCDLPLVASRDCRCVRLAAPDTN